MHYVEQEADEATVFTETPELSADTIVYLVNEKRVRRCPSNFTQKRFVLGVPRTFSNRLSQRGEEMLTLGFA